MKKVLLFLVVLVAVVAIGALAIGKGKAEIYKGYIWLMSPVQPPPMVSRPMEPT